MSWSKEWSSVVFSDEKRFNLDGPDGFQYYWHDLRKEPQYFSKQRFGGGGVMVWAGFGCKGKTNIAFIDGNMNAKKYQDMLETHLLPFASKISAKKWIYQQDNASIHNAKSTREWFNSKKIRLLDWAALSPDMNPTENLWGILSRKVYSNGRQFNSISDLKQAINESWEEIEVSTLKKLIDSMPNRIFELITKKGSKTHY
jgi:hypothetical protein